MRKHLFSILFLLVAAGIWWVSISSTVRNPYVDEKKPVVVVSGYVPYTLTNQLAQGSVNLIMLLPPGAEPHAFEPTPGVLVSLKKADAFIYVSDELEPWAKDLAKAAAPRSRVVQLANGLLPEQDPHVWMNIKQTEQMAREIETVLEQINPGQKLMYVENLKKFNAQAQTLARDFAHALATCKSRQVVHIGHLAFKNLADEYGLTLRTLGGTSHQGEHSAKQVAALVAQIKQASIPFIFSEEMLSSRLAQTVAQETGAQVLLLTPVEQVSKRDFQSGVTYEALMRRNLDSLKRGLQCQAF